MIDIDIGKIGGFGAMFQYGVLQRSLLDSVDNGRNLRHLIFEKDDIMSKIIDPFCVFGLKRLNLFRKYA